jgi:para-nitrobenzyl esterase
VLLLLLLGASCVSGGPQVQTTSGVVQGGVDNGVDYFLGIPFGDQVRFEKPTPAAPWSGVRDATSPGPQCTQVGPDPRVPTSEDCLVLNVFRPSGGAGTNRTLVWIHGGGYFLGNSAAYDGRQLARQGALVVTIQYRLGPFGFLPQAPNLGMFDQLLALQWVQKNAAAFGGSAERVTLAGESAGGGSVFAHVSSPLSVGLFQAAAALSPGMSQTFKCSHLAQIGSTIMSACNCSTVACVKAATTECLLSGFGVVNGGLIPPLAPCVDGDFLMGTPAVLLPFRPVRSLLVGVMQNEGAAITWPTISQQTGPTDDSPERAKRLISSFEPFSGASNLTAWYPVSGGPWRLLTDLASEYFITCLAQSAMRTIATHSYRFDAFVPGNPHSFLGATHAMDVPFWFNNASVPFGPSFPPFPPAHAALAARASRWLLDFPDTPPDSDVTVFAASGVTKEPQEPESSACAMWNDLFVKSG